MHNLDIYDFAMSTGTALLHQIIEGEVEFIHNGPDRRVQYKLLRVSGTHEGGRLYSAVR